jgi:EAL domain-containing protein (putative c-di-GMP-specific phosphodiesterase class I)
MTTGPLASVEELIFLDEIGLSFARRGDFLLKAAYQPLYMLAGDRLKPWAVEGSMRAIRFDPGDAAATGSGLPELQDEHFQQLSMALQIRNFRDLRDDGFRLIINLDLDAASDESDALALLRFLAVELFRADIDPRRVTCLVRQSREPIWLPEFLEAVLRERVALAVENFGVRSLPLQETIDIRPAFVRFNTRWLRQVAGSPAALRLLSTLVQRLREDGTEAIAPGLEDAGQLAALMRAGLRYFQGTLLSRPVLGGAIIGTGPVMVSSLLPDAGNVLALFPSSKQP